MHSNEVQIHSVMSESRFQISKTEKYYVIVCFNWHVNFTNCVQTYAKTPIKSLKDCLRKISLNFYLLLLNEVCKAGMKSSVTTMSLDNYLYVVFKYCLNNHLSICL